MISLQIMNFLITQHYQASWYLFLDWVRQFP